MLNEKVVEYAILAGLALHCQIYPVCKMARKNYSYPDLPKAYQISQHDMPLCGLGYLDLSNGRRIHIQRIHIEEDAGKLIHQNGTTFIDYNRCGVPLIEIVTEPDFQSTAEVREYVEKIQQLMRYLGISDCRMQEGSMRCDVNISIRPEGSPILGTRTEIKNMNSISYMVKAITYEYERQKKLLENGGTIIQETLRYNESEGTTSGMRSKEDAQDYRYFSEPDIPPIVISDEQVEHLRASLPELPETRVKRYVETYGLQESDAQQILKYRRIADFFDCAADGVKNPKNVANCILGQIFATFANESEKEAFSIQISPEQLRELVLLLESGKIRKPLLKTTLEKMLVSGKSATEFLQESDLQGISAKELEQLCYDALEKNPAAVKDYRNGKEKALKALLGAVMKASGGRALASDAEAVLRKLIHS